MKISKITKQALLKSSAQANKV